MQAEPLSSPTAGRGDGGCRNWSDLPRDLLAEIHGPLRFTDRLAFTAVFGDLFKPEAPWLVIPKDRACVYKTTFFSLADRRVTNVRTWHLRDNVLLGSSGGWLAMADKEGCMHLVNPVTGVQHALPAITTMVGLNIINFIGRNSVKSFSFQKEDFLTIRFGGPPYPEQWQAYPSSVHTHGSDMGDRVYRKVVLSASARPSCYAAMLILGWQCYSVPAFATSEDPTWRVAPPRDNVEDAVHHRGRFYTLSRFGIVEAWDQKELTSEVVTAGQAVEGDKRLATLPDGRLMVVSWDVAPFYKRHCNLPRSSKFTFKVHVLDEASGSWQETDDIGQAAVLVGARNNIMCVSTREHQKLMKGNCVYFTDEVSEEVRVYSLRHRRLYKINEFKQAEWWTGVWKAAAWFTPSFP